MDYLHGIEPVTVLKTRSAELIRRARESRSPVVITQNGKAAAVLQDVESFERQRKALLMLKLVVQGQQDVVEAKTLTDDEADRRFREKLESLGGIG